MARLLGETDIDKPNRCLIFGYMRFSTQTISRITRALVALGIGALTGAASAVMVVEGRFGALADIIWRVVWIIRGRPMAPYEADDGWFLEIEMKYALGSAILIALAGSVAWAGAARLNRQSYRSAALIGFVFAALMAVILLYWEETAQATVHIILIGLSGAIAGVITHAIGQAPVAPLSRFR